MSKSDTPRRTTISQATSIDEIADYWDTHSLDEHWDETAPAEFEVQALRRHRVTIEPDLYARLEEQARTRGVLLETLVNLWLTERLQDTRH